MSLPFSLMKEEKRPSVLVVDDVSANLELMEAVFQRAGYSVHMASGAESCNRYLQQLFYRHCNCGCYDAGDKRI